jgi:hypothetical protein
MSLNDDPELPGPLASLAEVGDMDCGAVDCSSDSVLHALEATTMPPIRTATAIRICLDVFM